jgi:hypothetical protein
MMPNRALIRRGARELTPEELEQAKAAGAGCQGTTSNFNGRIDEDFKCDPA